MAGTKVYDKTGTQIYPITTAEAVQYDYQQYHDVKASMDGLWETLKVLNGKITGADQIEAKLGVAVGYNTNNSPTDHPESWGSSFVFPDSKRKYAWKRTVYTWAGDEVATIYEIVATAVYPETQFLFCSTSSNMTELQGPTGYPQDNSTSVKDKNGVAIWHTTPQPVSSTSPQAYMATRTREANKEFKEDGSDFGFALYGNFAFSSMTVDKYYVTTSTDACPDPKDSLSLPGWLDQVTPSDLQSGTNYIYQVHATQVGGDLQNIGDRIWSVPSLISIINK